jgi:hypothetical protein
MESTLRVAHFTPLITTPESVEEVNAVLLSSSSLEQDANETLKATAAIRLKNKKLNLLLLGLSALTPLFTVVSVPTILFANNFVVVIKKSLVRVGRNF